MFNREYNYCSIPIFHPLSNYFASLILGDLFYLIIHWNIINQLFIQIYWIYWKSVCDVRLIEKHHHRKSCQHLIFLHLKLHFKYLGPYSRFACHQVTHYIWRWQLIQGVYLKQLPRQKNIHTTVDFHMFYTTSTENEAVICQLFFFIHWMVSDLPNFYC